MRPTMRPDSTRKFTSSSARVVPKVLPRPRATISSLTTALLVFVRVVRGGAARGRQRRSRRGRNLVELVEELLGLEAEALDAARDLRPLLVEEELPLVLQEGAARALGDEHAAAAALLDEVLVDELLVALQDREGIEPVLRRDAADRRQRIAVVQHALEDHRHHAVAQLAIDRGAVVPVRIHRVQVSWPATRLL